MLVMFARSGDRWIHKITPTVQLGGLAQLANNITCSVAEWGDCFVLAELIWRDEQSQY